MADDDHEKLVRYITEKVARYVATPAEVRKLERKQRSSRKESWTIRWFGLIPFTLSVWMNRMRNRR